MNRTRWFAAVLAATSVFAPSRTGFAADDPVDNPMSGQFLQVWEVQVTPDEAAISSGRNAFNDMVLFETDGFFTAEAFGPLGFGRSQYTLTTLSETAIGFTTTMSNGEQGTIVWNGVLSNSRIVGTMVWSKPDGSSGTYDFSAAPLD